MFKKVLIAEDHEIANLSVQKTLHDLGVADTKYVYYCDHALNWVKNALRDGEPYELLITDLEFEDDDSPQQLRGGMELIEAVKAVQPQLKIIILSAKDRSPAIDALIKAKTINGYVRKARRDSQYLKEALEASFNNKTYQSPDTRSVAQERNSHEFTQLDTHIVKLLCEGVPQKSMPFYLRRINMKPSSLSSVEKRLNIMKEVLDFTKNEQLVAYCKEMGLV